MSWAFPAFDQGPGIPRPPEGNRVRRCTTRSSTEPGASICSAPSVSVMLSGGCGAASENQAEPGRWMSPRPWGAQVLRSPAAGCLRCTQSVRMVPSSFVGPRSRRWRPSPATRAVDSACDPVRFLPTVTSSVAPSGSPRARTSNAWPCRARRTSARRGARPWRGGAAKRVMALALSQQAAAGSAVQDLICRDLPGADRIGPAAAGRAVRTPPMASNRLRRW